MMNTSKHGTPNRNKWAKEIKMKNAKKVTLATIKSFIRKNEDSLHILTKSRFNGMIDGCEKTGQKAFIAVEKTERNIRNTLGINGAWFVLDSGDRFYKIEKDGFVGYEIYNCCASFVLAIPA